MAHGSGEREEFPAIFRKLNTQGTAAAGTKRQVNGGHADDVAPAVGGIGPPSAVLASGQAVFGQRAAACRTPRGLSGSGWPPVRDDLVFRPFTASAGVPSR